MTFSEQEWVKEKAQLIEKYCGDPLFDSKKHIFMAELDRIHDIRHPNIAFDVLVIN